MSQAKSSSATSSTPFSTKDGAPITPATNTSPGRDFNKESRTQTPKEDEAPSPAGDMPHLRSRPQPTSPTSDYDVHADQTPTNGAKYASDSRSVAARGAGSVGNARSPFKVK
jgi:hypothetical protein